MSAVLILRKTFFLLIAGVGIIISTLIPASQFLPEKQKIESVNFAAVKFQPRQIGNFTPPEVSAKSVLVFDLESDTILFEKNSNLPITPSSLTKLATALVVSEQCSLDQVVTVPKIATPTGAKMGLVAGEKIIVKNLLYGLLLPSGNDAANVLVTNCFADFEEFLSSMKNLTQKLGMINTQFKNSSGLPAKGHFSTAADLAKLAKAILSNDTLAGIVATKEKNVTDVTGQISHQLTNLNKLLFADPQVLGIKTGTSILGENLMVAKEKEGHKIISIILASRDRFADTQEILAWVFQNFVWEPQVS